MLWRSVSLKVERILDMDVAEERYLYGPPIQIHLALSHEPDFLLYRHKNDLKNKIPSLEYRAMMIAQCNNMQMRMMMGY